MKHSQRFERLTIAAAAVAFATIAACQTPATAPSAGKTEWLLLEKGQVRPGRLLVDPQGKVAFLNCSGLVPSTNPATPPRFAGGDILVDLTSGKWTETAKFLVDLPSKLRIQQVVPSPNGEKLAVIASELSGTGTGRRMKFTCFLGDRKTGKSTELTTIIGNMQALWAGPSLLVSRSGTDGQDTIEKYSAEGKKLDMPETYGMLLAASRDGKQLAVFANADDSGKTLKFNMDAKGAILAISDAGKTIKRLSKPGQVTASCILSPVGKFAAVSLPIMDTSGRQGPPRCTISVVGIDSDKNWEIKPGTRYLLGITDEGIVYAMGEPSSLPAASVTGGGSTGVDIKQYDAEGKSKTIASGALDACISGNILYYVAAGTTPTLKAIPLDGTMPGKGKN